MTQLQGGSISRVAAVLTAVVEHRQACRVGQVELEQPGNYHVAKSVHPHGADATDALPSAIEVEVQARFRTLFMRGEPVRPAREHDMGERRPSVCSMARITSGVRPTMPFAAARKRRS
jgi:hypothetical protein